MPPPAEKAKTTGAGAVSDEVGTEGAQVPARKKKSFVRIVPSRKPAAPKKLTVEGKPAVKKPAKTAAPKTKSLEKSAARARDEDEVVDAELVDDDEDGGRALEGEVEVGESLPPALIGEDIGAGPAFVDIDPEEVDRALRREEKSLVLGTPLQRYLGELRRYPLLSREEEREIAHRAYDEKDMASRNRLVTANLRLVVKIAMEYRRAYSQILDLIQEGNAGLVQAVNRFNPYMGVKVSTYSAWWIRAYILKFLMDNKSLVRMGTTDAQRKLFFRLRGEAEKMYALTQRFDARLLAENIGVKEGDVIEMQQRLTKNDVSLDAPVRSEGDLRHIDTLVADIEEPDVIVERKELLGLLRDRVEELEKELGERDAYIFRERIMADDPVTLQDVGDKYGITRERARQLEARVLKRIREKLIEAGLGGTE